MGAGNSQTERENEVESIRMPLGAHLEELRRRVVYSVIAIIFSFFLCWFFKTQILSLAKRPHSLTMNRIGLSAELQVLSYQEGFYAYMKLCFITAVFLAYPFIIYQLWRFVSAGLYSRERKYVLLFLPISYAAFIVGGVFGYFLLIPLGLQFLIGILGPGIQPIITMQQYVSFVFLLTVALGLVFQLPLIMLLFSKIGFVTPQKFISWRKYAILVIFITAAIVTPPDPFTQCMTACPMILLYELGILIARPTRRGFMYLGTIVGCGLIIISGVYFYLSHKRGEIDLKNTTGNVQILYPGAREWKAAADEIPFRKGVAVKTDNIGKTAVFLEKQINIGIDTNTEVQFISSRKLLLKKGQMLISVKDIKESEKPVEVNTPNGVIRTYNGVLNVRVADYFTVVTAVKGEATLLLEGEEKKLLEGRQYRMIIGGDPVDIGSIIDWSEGVLPVSDKKDW